MEYLFLVAFSSVAFTSVFFTGAIIFLHRKILKVIINSLEDTVQLQNDIRDMSVALNEFENKLHTFNGNNAQENADFYLRLDKLEELEQKRLHKKKK